MKLIITEKASSARSVATALGASKRYNEHTLTNGELLITNCHGHLYRPKLPKEVDEEKYTKWAMKNLPIAFDDLLLTPSEDKMNRALIKNIKELLELDDVDEIVCAGDADREGESIPREVIYDLENKYSKIRKLNRNRTFTRMWYTEMNAPHLSNSYRNRKPLSKYDNVYMAQKGRATADYNVGMTGTQAMTVKFGGGSVMTVGRVQTPTLRIIVDLENEIRNFVPKDYYKVVAHTKEDIDGEYTNSSLDGNKFFSKKEDASSVIDKTGTGNAKVVEVLNKESKVYPKKLYSMGTLQSDMNKKYGLTAQETLDIAQKLYEQGFTTYPRTEEEVVSEAMAFALQSSVMNLLPVFDEYTNEIVSKGYKLNKDVIAKGGTFEGAHEAITPTTANVSESKFNSLQEQEKKVYLAIVERFLQNFYPPAIFDIQKIKFERKGSIFSSDFRALKSEGFLKIGNNKLEYDDIQKIKEGDILNINELELVESKTTPPSRFTEATLIEMMQNPIKYLDSKDEKDIIKETKGIGTGATRGPIIENLKKQGLIEVKKKVIYPTDKGMELIAKIPSDLIKSVSITAYFETRLKEIYEGRYSIEKFLVEIKNLLKTFVEDIDKMSSDTTSKYSTATKKDAISHEVLCKCPKCGSNIIVNDYGYFCENKDCGVKIFKTALEKSLGLKTISKTQAKELFSKGKTSKKAKFVSKKTSKDYEAFLTYKFDKSMQYPNAVWISIE